MPFQATHCIEVSCGNFKFSDTTGLYDANNNLTGYGTPNPDFGDLTPYTAAFYKPKPDAKLLEEALSDGPAYVLDLYAPAATIDDNQVYAYDIDKSLLGYTDGQNIRSGLWRVRVKLGSTITDYEYFSTGDVKAKVNKCVCGDKSKAVLELDLIAANRLYCCGKKDEAQEMIEQLYHDTACCCGC